MKKQFKKLMSVRGMGAALTAFVGLIIIYVAFGLIEPQVFTWTNIRNLLRSMSKYLLVGVGQSYLLITGNIDLSIASTVGMRSVKMPIPRNGTKRPREPLLQLCIESG